MKRPTNKKAEFEKNIGKRAKVLKTPVAGLA